MSLGFWDCSHSVHMVAKSQEIPATFTAETGWPGNDECALVTSVNFAKEWPLQFRRYSDVHTGVSAVFGGGGWAKFVADHHLGDGAFLTFEVVDERSLVVARTHAARCADINAEGSRGSARQHVSMRGATTCLFQKTMSTPL